MTKLPWNPRADNAGTEPEIGDFVAYNYSGQIATGYIARMSRSTITILQVRPEEGHVSRIKGGAKCLLVLDRG